MSPDPIDPTPASDSAAAARPSPNGRELAAGAVPLGAHSEALKRMLAGPAGALGMGSVAQSVLTGLTAKNAALAPSAFAGLKDIAAKMAVYDEPKASDAISKLTSGWAKDYAALTSTSALDSFAKRMLPEIAPIRIPELAPLALPPPAPDRWPDARLIHDMRDQVTSEIRATTEATNANTAATVEAVREFKGIRRATLPLWATLTVCGIMIVLGTDPRG